MDRPTLAEVLQQAMDARAAQIRTAIPAEVYVYSHSTQTASVRPTVWTDGEAPPIIPYVPVYWPRGNGAYLHMPLRAHSDKWLGTMGLLIACEADIGEWRRTGQEGPPADEARHHLQSAVFFPGIPSYDNVMYPEPDNASCILAGGPVRLGDPSATSNVVHEELLGELSTLLGFLSTWVTNCQAIVGVIAGTAAVTGQCTAMINGIAAGDYESPTVFVED